MTIWNRLEPNSSDDDLEESVEARIADPLWMMARQWQLGEFKGEDAASPIHARAVVDSSPVLTFRNEAAPGAKVESFSSDRPLECRVEAETVIDGPSAVGLAAEAGAQFLRRLELAGLGEVRRSVAWAEGLGFDLAADGIDVTILPLRVQRRLDLLDRRGLDGRKLYALGEAKVKGMVPERGDEVVTVYRAWRLEYAGRFDQPGESGDCWIDERFEYGFSLGVATEGGEIVLAADEYHGGRLDWHAFAVDGDKAKSHGLEARKPTTRQVELLPQPAMFRGQGAPRWWEFEDRSVYFGNLSAGPADVARLVVAEYGTVFSDDWFVIPLGVDVATLNRVRRLQVIDVFGGATDVKAAAVNDHAVYGEDRPFRFFELEGDPSAESGAAPWLFVPPALADSQHGHAGGARHAGPRRTGQPRLGDRAHDRAPDRRAAQAPAPGQRPEGRHRGAGRRAHRRRGAAVAVQAPVPGAALVGPARSRAHRRGSRRAAAARPHGELGRGGSGRGRSQGQVGRRSRGAAHLRGGGPARGRERDPPLGARARRRRTRARVDGAQEAAGARRSRLGAEVRRHPAEPATRLGDPLHVGGAARAGRGRALSARPPDPRCPRPCCSAGARRR